MMQYAVYLGAKRQSTINNYSTISVNCLTAYATTISTGQKDEYGCDFAGLTGTAHRACELVLLLLAHRRGHERCPNRPWSNSVDTNALAKELIRKTTSKGDDGTLCRGIVQEIRTADISIDTCIGDDCRAWLEVRSGIFGDEKEANVALETSEVTNDQMLDLRMNVCVESRQPLFFTKVINLINSL